MSSRMSWFALLALAWRVVAQVPAVYLAARQDPDLPHLVFSGDFDSVLTSCAPVSFTWTYTGPDGSFAFFITNIGIDQDTTTSTGLLPTATDSSGPHARSPSRRDIIYTSIASSVSTHDQGLNLTSLSVPQGRYWLFAILESMTPTYTVRSPVFTVQEGTNTSCLTSFLTSSTSSTSTSSSSATSNLASTTSSDVLTSGSTSPTVVPVGEVSSTPVNKGAIAGGVVAGAVILIAAVSFYFFLVVYPRRSRAHSRASGGSHGHPRAKGGFGIGAPGGGRWGGLGSVDSHVPSNDPKAQKPYVSTGHQSNGPGASQDEINSYLSRSGSVTYGGYAGSPSEEKFSGSPSEEMALSTLPYRGTDPNVYAPNNTRSYSASPTSEHRHSQSGAWRTSLDSSSIHAQAVFASPPTSSPIPLANTPLAGAQNPPRRTARKPVPAYDESSVSPATSPVTSSPLTPATTPFADPVIPYPAYPAPVSSGHYSTRAERESLKSLSSKSKLKLRNKDKSNTSSANASSEEIAQQELAHKNSFGPGGLEGRQLHYLIPDMPVGHQ